MIPNEIASTIVSPWAYSNGKQVDDAFAWLRREMPLEQAQPEGYDPFWVVTRHADILEVERQNDLFHNGDRSAVLTTIEAEQVEAPIKRLQRRMRVTDAAFGLNDCSCSLQMLAQGSISVLDRWRRLQAACDRLNIGSRRIAKLRRTDMGANLTVAGIMMGTAESA